MVKNVFISDGVVNLDLLSKEKCIYILSVSRNAKIIFSLLLQYKVKVSGFAVKEKQNITKMYSLPVSDLKKTEEEDSLYVIDEDEWNSNNYLMCEKKIYLMKIDESFQNEFVFYEQGNIRRCNAALTLTMILSRVPKRQPVFIIKSQDYDFWINLVNVLEKEIKNPKIIVADTDSEQIYDLMYLDIEKLMVFISLFGYKEMEETLISIGLKPTQNFVHISNSFSGHITDKYFGFDWLLGNTFVGKIDEKCCNGFYVHSNTKAPSYKIVILGNSTTDPLFYPQKSWPEMLWEKYIARHIDVIIYNGAITDYSSNNEVIKFIRDVLRLDPDIVVSYSGVIDFGEYIPDYPYVNLNLMRTSKEWEEKSNKKVVYGLEDHRSAYERWLENETIIHQICEMKGISFSAVLQPWIGSDCVAPTEKLQIWNDYYWEVEYPQFNKYISNAQEFKERIVADVKKNDWLHDFTNIFEQIDDTDIYYDSIHVNEIGNQIVAEKFYELIGL